MEIREIRWLDANYGDIEEHGIYYSEASNKCEHGVGIVMNKSVVQIASNYIPLLPLTSDHPHLEYPKEEVLFVISGFNSKVGGGRSKTILNLMTLERK